MSWIFSAFIRVPICCCAYLLALAFGALALAFAPAPSTGSCRRLMTIATMLGHTHINLLKMDIEGAEYTSSSDRLSSGLQIEQLLVEFHYHGNLNRRRRNQTGDLTPQACRLPHCECVPDGCEFTLFVSSLQQMIGAAAVYLR